MIYEDKLGLSKRYIQAKRNDTGNIIRKPLLQAFIGATQNVQKLMLKCGIDLEKIQKYILPIG